MANSFSLRLKLFFLVLLCLYAGSQKTFAGNLSRQVDAYLQQEMAKFRIPGLAVAVVKDGRILKAKGYGVSNIELNIPVTEKSVFPLYSSTKIFTGVSIMKLVEEGKLSLETPITEVIDNLPPAWKAITIRHLLTFTAGLPKLRDSARFMSLPDEKKASLSREEAIPYLAEAPIVSKPGEKWVYENTGHNLLGVIISKLTGKSYEEFLKERVFNPLGMSSTRMGDSQRVIKGRFPTDYIFENGTLQTHTYYFGVDGGNPGSGLNSSVKDLAEFFAALEAGSVLKPTSLEEIWLPVKLNDGKEVPYGLSWTVNNHNGLKVVGHEGGGAAWSAYFPAEHLAVIILCNLNNSQAEEIQYGVANFYLKNNHIKTTSERSMK